MPGIDTNADSNRTFFLTIDFKTAFSDPLSYCLRHFHRFIPVPPEQAYKKFLPAKTNSRHIIILTAPPDNLRDLLQTHIASNMTISVVKFFKIIDIQHHTRDRTGFLFQFLYFLPDKPLHIPPVIHIRQLINHGLMAQNLIYPGNLFVLFSDRHLLLCDNHLIPVKRIRDSRRNTRDRKTVYNIAENIILNRLDSRQTNI